MVLNGTSWLKWMRTGGSPNRRKPRFLVGDEDIFSLANSAPVRAHLELPPWCLSDWGFFFIPPRRNCKIRGGLLGLPHYQTSNFNHDSSWTQTGYSLHLVWFKGNIQTKPWLSQQNRHVSRHFWPGGWILWSLYWEGTGWISKLKSSLVAGSVRQAVIFDLLILF